jgi:hypothetical protein
MHVCSFPSALIALSKMMTACAEQRLQFFFVPLIVEALAAASAGTSDMPLAQRPLRTNL